MAANRSQRDRAKEPMLTFSSPLQRYTSDRRVFAIGSFTAAKVRNLW